MCTGNRAPLSCCCQVWMLLGAEVWEEGVRILGKMFWGWGWGLDGKGERQQGGESDSMGGGEGREGPGEHRKVLWSLALQDESE